MQNTPPELIHLTRPPAAPPQDGSAQGSKPPRGGPPLLLLLHGVGSDEHDLMQLAPFVDSRFFVISARGPLAHAQSGAAWYPVTFTEQGITADETVAPSSRDKIADFIGAATRFYGLDPERVFIGGFSQGAILSLFTLLTRPELIAGAALMSGRLLPAAWEERADDDPLRGLPVFAAHGLYDPVLPVAHGREIRDKLSQTPLDFTYREYPMAHEISPESLRDATAFLSARLDQLG